MKLIYRPEYTAILANTHAAKIQGDQRAATSTIPGHPRHH